jgi:hypothetical protein
MPVYDRADVEIVGQIDPEPLSGIEHQSLSAGPGEAKDRGRATVDVERACDRGKAKSVRGLRKGKPGHLRNRNGGCTCGKKAAS